MSAWDLLPMRQRGGDVTEVQCPACGRWRASFLVGPDGAGGWHCDAERSIVERQIAAEAVAAAPAPERQFSKPEFLNLWTPLETVAVMQSADGLMAYLWARMLAWDGPFLLSDSRVLAGILQAETLGLITAESAARKRAGLPPA